MIDKKNIDRLNKYFPLEVDYYQSAHDAINFIDRLTKAEEVFKSKAKNLIDSFNKIFLKPINEKELIDLHLTLTIVWEQREDEDWYEKNRLYIKLRNKADQVYTNQKSRFEPENIDTYLNKKSVFHLFDFLTIEGFLNKENSYYFISQFLFESQGTLNSEDAVKKMIYRRDKFH